MSEHILVVDDSKTVRNLLSFVLKNEGYKVVTAENGLEGLEKLYSIPGIRLILSDVNMPRMDGFSFIKSVREQAEYHDVPIIMLSTQGEEGDIETGMNLGADMYMVKPAHPDVVIRNIKKLLG